MTGFKGTDRYVVLRYLGSGSFGEVYEVFDRERQTKVALKIPHEATAAGLYYFKREFRSLVDLVHPNLAALYELVGDKDQWFFTMELIQGIPFRNFLRKDTASQDSALNSSDSQTRRTPPRSTGGYWAFPESLQTLTVGCSDTATLPPPDVPTEQGDAPCTPPADHRLVRALLRQLAEGLTTLHEAGKLHRDIKPSNVLVSEDGHLSILDFGLVVEMSRGRRDDQLATHLIGTPAYMAPEQLDGYRGTESSDWYSVGVMLYEALTGRQPFSGSLMEMIRKKMEEYPPSPSSLVPGTPADLDALCMGLLKRDPAERPTGAEILECVKDSGSLLPSPEEPRPAASSPVLVGRDRELASLFEAFRTMRAGTPCLIKLHGGSGTGKTHLIRHFVHEVQRQEPQVVVLQGRCYEQESLPFKAIDPLIDDLSRHLSHLPRERVDPLVPRNAQALTRLFPVLNRIDAFSRHPAQTLDLDDAKAVRRRAILALRELLARLRDHHPLIVIIDDLQWGDLDSASLLAELMAAPDPPTLMLVVCYRSEEETTAPVLVELLARPIGLATRDLPLMELSPRLAEDLAMALIGTNSSEVERLAKRIARDSGGNPFFIGELAHHTQAGFAHESQAAENTLYGCIQQRIANLPEEIQRIVETLALAGHPLSWDVIKKTSGMEGAKLPPAPLLKAARLVRTRSTKDQPTLEIYHDFVRRAVLSTLTGPLRRKGHLRLAEVLEACGEGEPETLARHYVLAGESRKASDFTARAAERAAEAFAFKGAAELYRKSIDFRPINDPENPDLLLRLANALSSAGLGRESAETYLLLAPMLGAPDRQRLERRAAEEYFRSGYFDLGVETLKPLLKTIGMRLPSGAIATRIYSTYYSVRLRLRGLRFKRRDASQIPADDLERLDTCWAAVQGFGTGALVKGMDLQVRHLLMALDVGEPSRVIRALAHQTLLESMRGTSSLSRTHRYQTTSLALAEKFEDPKLSGYAYLTAGIAAMLQGRWISSCNLLERAKAIYSDHCVGVTSELQQVHHNLLSVHFVLGHFEDLQHHVPELIRDAEERGDLLAEANLKTGYSLFHHLAKDDPESARRKLERARQIWSSREFHSQHFQALYLGGLIDQYCGLPDRPWNAIPEQSKLLEASRLLDIQYIRIAWSEHRARTAVAFAWTCPQETQARIEASRIARAAIKDLHREKTDYGHATYLKLRSIEASLSGRNAEAIQWCHRAQLAYENCHMPLHAHIVLWCRGVLLGTAGGGLIHEAEDWMHTQGIHRPDKYATMHAPCVGVLKK